MPLRSAPRWFPGGADFRTDAAYLGAVTPGHVIPGNLKFASSIRQFFPIISEQTYVMPEYTMASAKKVFSRFEQPALQLNLDAYRKATKWMYRIWAPYMTTMPWTHEEVVADFDLNTSVGYPYSTQFANKREMFESCGTDWLRQCYELYGKAPYRSVFDQSLKEELRPIGKDPRGILAAPVDNVYISKRVFGSQTAGFYLSANETPSAVGMVREHLGWARLFKQLSRHKTGISIDIKRFDSRLARFVMETIRDFRIYCGAPANYAVPLYAQLIDTMVRLPDGSLRLKRGGNPSGSTTTTPDNTQGDFLEHTTCLIEQFPEMTFEQFRDWFEMKLFGDDNTTTNGIDVDWDLHIRLITKNFGHECTIEAIGPPCDLKFLSGGFKEFYVGDKFIVVPVMDSIKMANHLLFKNKKVSDVRVLERLFAIRRLCPFNDDLMPCVTAAIEYLAKYVNQSEYAQYHVSLDAARALYLYPALEYQSKFKTSLVYEMRRSNRRDAFSQILAFDGLSETTKASLVQSLDPFHDTDFNPVGVPDGVNGKSVVQIIKKTFSIQSPFADKTIPFDCHIFSLPDAEAYTQFQYTPDSQTGTTAAGNSAFGSGTNYGVFPVAPLVWVCVPVGADTTPANGTSNIIASGTINVASINEFLNGQCRLIAQAFETHNVTNELSVSGTCTVYRMSQSRKACSLRFLPGNSSLEGEPFNRWTSDVSRCPPASLGDVLLLPNSKQWEAKYGAYSVCSFELEKENQGPSLPSPHLFVAGSFSPEQSGGDPILPGFGRNVNVDGPTQSTFGAATKPNSSDTSGQYYSGLNGNTQITLTCFFALETFPTQENPLVTLATTPPAYDPVFFQLHKQAVDMLPPGVMVGENASGDFWQKVLGVVKQFAPMIGPMLGPVGAALGPVIGTAAGLGRDKLAEMQAVKRAAKAAKKKEERQHNTFGRVVESNPGAWLSDSWDRAPVVRTARPRKANVVTPRRRAPPRNRAVASNRAPSAGRRN